LTVHGVSGNIGPVERDSVVAIVQALNDAGARYLVAGGVAVVAHGYVRYTADLDLIVDIAEDNLRRFLPAIERLGYRPRVPVPIGDFADATKRRAWVTEKGLVVFSLSSPMHPMTEIDLFVEPPLDFDAAYSRSVRQEVASGVLASFVGFDDLVNLKREAGRPHDLEDIDKLTALRGRPSDD
jgi:hypothetical protein